MRKYAVIVAGGSGTRLGGDIPKQFRILEGRPLVWWSLRAFHAEDAATRIILVVPSHLIDMWRGLFDGLPEKEKIEHTIVGGGATRTESVENGLRMIDANGEALVAIHDAARPLVNLQIVRNGWAAALKYKAAVPVVPVTDSLRMLTKEGNKAIDRSDFVAIQTPQVFDASLLLKAYAEREGATLSDDASVVENAGTKIHLYEGSPLNIKVTNPGDIEVAAIHLKRLYGIVS